MSMRLGLPRFWALGFDHSTETGSGTHHFAVLGCAALAVLAFFARDTSDIVRIWWTSSTYNHCVFIPFLAAWLVYQRKEELRAIAPKAWLPGAAVVLLAACVWVMGDAAGLGQLRHIGLVLMLQALVLTIMGPNVTRAVLFPLFYLSFMVPAGEELVPYLQTITAKMCMVLLSLTGIPANINGVFITIPNGYFEVAEACSGVKFLVAMIAYGALVANVCFQSWSRRVVFMAVASVVPILANGLRAFCTIYYAHMTNVEAAAGFDHVVYGWFFFAFVMILVMGIGWRFFDRGPNDPWLSGFKSHSVSRTTSPLLACAVAAAAILIPAIAQASMERAGHMAMPHQIQLPSVSGWTRVEARAPYWSPQFQGADHRLDGHYQNSTGDVVDLSIVLFAWQEEGRELIGFGQGATVPDGPWTWASAAPSPDRGRAERLVTNGPVNREVASFYVTNKGQTGSVRDVKMAAMVNRLTGGDQAVAAILVSAVDLQDRPARVAIDRFVKDMGPPERLAARLIKEARGR
jgi:exosortase A